MQQLSCAVLLLPCSFKHRIANNVRCLFPTGSNSKLSSAYHARTHVQDHIVEFVECLPRYGQFFGMNRNNCVRCKCCMPTLADVVFQTNFITSYCTKVHVLCICSVFQISVEVVSDLDCSRKFQVVHSYSSQDVWLLPAAYLGMREAHREMSTVNQRWRGARGEDA